MSDKINWDVLDPHDWPHTPPLAVYRELEKLDPNLFWRMGSGHAQNLLAEANDRLDGLREETTWSDDGKPEVQARMVELYWSADGIFIGTSTVPATDEELRAFGLVKKRRLISAWEVVP